MTTDGLSEQVYETAAELWPTLTAKAGLTGGRGGRSGRYDADILDDLRARLFPDTTEPLDKLFAESSLSAEALLRAFFDTMRPFALMSQDILELLSAAGANGSGEALSIRFEFEPGNPLDMLLEDFRRQMMLWSERTSKIELWKIGSKDLWRIVKAGGLRSADTLPPTLGSPPWSLTAWLRRYQAGAIESLPEHGRTGRKDVDDRFSRVAALANQFVAACHRHGGHDRDSLSALALDPSTRDTKDDIGLTIKELWDVESDYWLKGIYDFFEDWGRLLGSFRTPDKELMFSQMMAEIDEILPADAASITFTALSRTLESLLDLPVWKYRHEVYAVWLGAQIYKSLVSDGWQFRFHLVDGRLEFAFRGVHLATLTRAGDSSVLMWWTEYSTFHDDLPSGHRTEAIQPDYRILRAPLSDPHPDVLVVEAKQHLRSSSQEFADALIDYAHACPRAGVLLANYGPAAENLLERVGSPLRARSEAHEHVHPGEPDNVDAFRSDIARVVAAALRGDVASAFVPTAEIRLTWGSTPRDLDLHVWRKDRPQDHVSYRNQSGFGITLSDDVTSGHGPETAIIDADDGEFIVAVHQYSSDGALADSNAEIQIITGKRRFRRTASFKVPSGESKWWSVASIDMQQGTVVEIGEVSSDDIGE